MPNWCYNEIEASGSEKEVKRFIGFLEGYYPEYKESGIEKTFKKEKKIKSIFCFNNVIPVPKETLKAGFDGHERKGNNLCLDGYNWQIENWGTKWGCCCEEKILSKDKKLVLFTFNTAWEMPTFVIIKLQELFPELEITITADYE